MTNNSDELNIKGNRSKRNKKRKVSGKLIAGFVAFEILFTAVTAPFILLYGPFETAKKTFLSTAMSSMHYKWLATTFMSEDEINDYLGITAYDNSETNNKDTEIKIDTSKSDTVKCKTIGGNSKFDGYVLEIGNPKKVRIGYSSKLGTEGEKTSTIAKNAGAIAAVNGGAFTDGNSNSGKWTQNGGQADGTIMTEGKMIFNNVTNKDEKRDQIAITEDGRLLVGKWTLNELEAEGAREIVSFNPALIVNGEKVQSIPEIGRSPKTLIGQKQDGTILLVVLDSSSDTRVSASTLESQELMYQLGCVTAACLDGGRSATMYYKGEIVNKPCNPTGERAIASAVIVLP